MSDRFAAGMVTVLLVLVCAESVEAMLARPDQVVSTPAGWGLVVVTAALILVAGHFGKIAVGQNIASE